MNAKINIQDVIKLVIFIAGLLGTFYAQKTEVDLLSEKVNRLEKQLDDTNLGVIKNDIEYIKKGQSEIKEGLRDYFAMVNQLISDTADD